jgi:hypothetical protein
MIFFANFGESFLIGQASLKHFFIVLANLDPAMLSAVRLRAPLCIAQISG